jgi:hypothetical protein
LWLGFSPRKIEFYSLLKNIITIISNDICSTHTGGLKT